MTTVSKLFVCGLLTLGAVLGFAGVDLVLPAIPILPSELDSDAATAQLVLAAFVAGSALGLLLFGALGERLGRRNCLAGGLITYGLVSWAAAHAQSMDVLIGARLVQGVASAAPGVFAPGIIRAFFSERGATRVLGALGSIESLTPAIAPVVGLWLLDLGGWRLSFWVIAGLAAALGLVFLLLKDRLPRTAGIGRDGSYLRLLKRPVFLRYALSQACTLGGLLVFVFGAPAAIVRSMGGEISDFIGMQVVGIASFIVASNLVGLVVDRLGAERAIWIGTLLAAFGAAGILAFAMVGDGDSGWLMLLFVPVNIGLGLRGPPGFLAAIIAGEGDDDRAASLTLLAIFLVVSGGTAAIAPLITEGLAPLAAAALAIHLAAVLFLAILPKPRTA